MNAPNQPPSPPDSPLIRRILTLVAQTCEPRAPRWTAQLACALAAFLYAPWTCHAVLRTEGLQRLDARVAGLEADL